MTTAPTFPRFAAAPKCDPALLVQPHELLLDRPVRKRLSTSAKELVWWFALMIGVVYLGWLAYRVGELEQIEAQRAELDRLVGNEESLELMGADRAAEAIVRAIERTTDRLISDEGTE